MKIAATQPNFFPWIGYFDLLDTVDKIVFLDNVELSTRSFMIRNRMKNKNDETFWISASVKHKSQSKKIGDHFIVGDKKWLIKLINKLGPLYAEADYYNDLLEILEKIKTIRKNRLSEFNTEAILIISEYLGIEFEYSFASSFTKPEYQTPQDRILDICTAESATQFYNFKKGIEVGLYQPEEFAKIKIKLFKQDYLHPAYKQTAANFVPYLSILDLIANQGNKSRDIIRSGTNWKLMN